MISLANVALDGEVFYRAWLGDIPWVGGKHAYIGELGRLGVLHRKRGVTNGNFVYIVLVFLHLDDFYLSPLSNRSWRRFEISVIVMFPVNRRGHLHSARRMEEDAGGPVSVFAVVPSTCEVNDGCPAVVSVRCR